jgi:hypothetical protein
LAFDDVVAWNAAGKVAEIVRVETRGLLPGDIDLIESLRPAALLLALLARGDE